MGKLRTRQSFSHVEEILDMPDLIEVQKNSYQRFLDVDLREVLDDVSPIVDYTENLSLEFVDYTLEAPKNSVERCKERDMTYAAPLKVFVRLKKEQGVIYFSVTDTGNGIKPEEIDGIWERYYRSSEAHKRPVQGTGLGLSIVKTILDRHQFLYGIESEYGHGSTFYVILPLKGEEVAGEEEA